MYICIRNKLRFKKISVERIFKNVKPYNKNNQFAEQSRYLTCLDISEDHIANPIKALFSLNYSLGLNQYHLGFCVF